MAKPAPGNVFVWTEKAYWSTGRIYPFPVYPSWIEDGYIKEVPLIEGIISEKEWEERQVLQ